MVAKSVIWVSNLKIYQDFPPKTVPILDSEAQYRRPMQSYIGAVHGCIGQEVQCNVLHVEHAA